MLNLHRLVLGVEAPRAGNFVEWEEETQNETREGMRCRPLILYSQEREREARRDGPNLKLEILREGRPSNKHVEKETTEGQSGFEDDQTVFVDGSSSLVAIEMAISKKDREVLKRLSSAAATNRLF
ncbi:hypothetical protein U1Q18_014302 [Sarracenia purpurea var. burkii]